MIKIVLIDEARKNDINIKNEPFTLFGQMAVSYKDGIWSYTEKRFDKTEEMRFPDENYDFEKMSKDYAFLGAYDGDKCVGLSILQNGFFKYMYLYDLKVNSDYRGKGIGKMLIDASKEFAEQNGYNGIYTIGQDNNLGACLFYIKNGFRIGGLDTEVYKGTSQEGKSDIIFYRDKN